MKQAETLVAQVPQAELMDEQQLVSSSAASWSFLSRSASAALRAASSAALRWRSRSVK